MNTDIDIQQLAYLVRAKRGENDLRSTAQEIGNVSASTLSRIERGMAPDLITFVHLCQWLGIPFAQLIRNTPERAAAIKATKQIISLEVERIEKQLVELRRLLD